MHTHTIIWKHIQDPLKFILNKRKIILSGIREPYSQSAYVKTIMISNVSI